MCPYFFFSFNIEKPHPTYGRPTPTPPTTDTERVQHPNMHEMMLRTSRGWNHHQFQLTFTRSNEIHFNQFRSMWLCHCSAHCWRIQDAPKSFRCEMVTDTMAVVILGNEFLLRNRFSHTDAFEAMTNVQVLAHFVKNRADCESASCCVVNFMLRKRISHQYVKKALVGAEYKIKFNDHRLADE